jgi:hypothetical protein
MMKSKQLVGLRLAAASIVAGVAFSLAGFEAHADTIYSNPYNPSGSGSCAFSTTCASLAASGDDYAAQEFSLATSVTIDGASFTIATNGALPTSVNWMLSGTTGGLPGASIGLSFRRVSRKQSDL